MSAACAPVAFTAALTARSTQTRASTQPCSRIQTEQIVLGWPRKARTRAHARRVARVAAYRASPLRNAMRSSRSCAQLVSSQLRVAGESSPWRWQSRNAGRAGSGAAGARSNERAPVLLPAGFEVRGHEVRSHCLICTRELSVAAQCCARHTQSFERARSVPGDDVIHEVVVAQPTRSAAWRAQSPSP